MGLSREWPVILKHHAQQNSKFLHIILGAEFVIFDIKTKQNKKTNRLWLLCTTVPVGEVCTLPLTSQFIYARTEIFAIAQNKQISYSTL